MAQWDNHGRVGPGISKVVEGSDVSCKAPWLIHGLPYLMLS